MSPSPAKSSLYSSTLDSARRAALWSTAQPATKDGHLVTGAGAGGQQGGMDWKELLRKFGKHNQGREVESAAALLNLTLRQLLHESAPAPTLSPLSVPSPLPSSAHASQLRRSRVDFASDPPETRGRPAVELQSGFRDLEETGTM